MKTSSVNSSNKNVEPRISKELFKHDTASISGKRTISLFQKNRQRTDIDQSEKPNFRSTLNTFQNRLFNLTN